MPAVIDRFTRRGFTRRGFSRRDFTRRGFGRRGFSRRDHRNADRATGVLAGVALVAGAWFFLDPQQGARRRHAARDRTAAMLRARKREAARKARYAEGVAQGMAYRAGQAVSSSDAEQPQPDDVTLARKVETEIFRPADAPKGQVDVNVDHGVVFLRGTLDDPDKAEDLVAAAGKVGGVREVRNLIQTR